MRQIKILKKEIKRQRKIYRINPDKFNYNRLKWLEFKLKENE